ncbi:ABC transporter permease [Halococcoides cellulosivorans]|uniref:ABC transporter permease n=1 Tax=Halococcoides cellulosivorans TaxID=1679096 RepID=UPI001F322092|nr:PrsW family intramembrane metalloprotease [Halococcoides cellulosivorans]
MRWRPIARIARWELAGSVAIDRRTGAMIAVALLLASATLPVAAIGGVSPESGLFRIGVEETSPYHPVVDDDPVPAPALAVRSPDNGEIDVLVQPHQISLADSEKGRAAYTDFRGAIGTYNDVRMRAEADQSAAFPVTVAVQYVERSAIDLDAGDAGDGSVGDGSTGGTGGDGPGGTGDGGTGDASDGEVSDAGGSLGGLGGLLATQNSSRSDPSSIDPPFPFRSLIFAFLFVLPLNFVIQAYGSSMLRERLNRRGELTLVAPVTPSEIVAGKTLPYLAIAVGFEVLLAVGIGVLRGGSGAGPLAVLAVLPIVGLFLGLTFLAAMFARSFKELTFLTVTITVGVTSYAFVPAIFTDQLPIALISPLTIVVRDLQGLPIEPGAALFSMGPPALVALIAFGLGMGLYREEDLFTQRPVPWKVLDAFAGRITGVRSAALLSAALIPFVFVAELIGVAALFPVSLSYPTVAIVLVLVVVALVEEAAKSIHLYAGVVHDLYPRTRASALKIGIASGLGFFVAEKFVLIVALAGGETPAVQEAALVTGGVPESVPVLIGFLLAPLVLHAGTATLSALGAIGGRRRYAVGYSLAVVVHLAYNLVVVMALA